jgi:hypothetical protein
MAEYFFPRPISTFSILAATIGGVFILVAIPLLLLTGVGVVTVVLLAIGLILLLFGVRSMIVTRRSNPGDEDYDDWLERQARALRPRALRTLSLDEQQITSKIVCVHSILLPGSSLANNYHDEVYLKQGKDGQWRSSVNLYTYFFPSERFIAIFTRDINAFSPKGPYNDVTEEYFYRDIIGVSTSVFRDTVLIGEAELVYRVQQLSLKLINGENQPFGGYLSAMPFDTKRGLPTILSPDAHVNTTLNDLRVLLRVKKQRTR